MIETAVVSLGKGQDELVRSLVTRHNLDARLLDSAGVHHSDELIQQRGLLFEKLRGFALHCLFELCSVRTGNAVPRFGFSPEHCNQLDRR